LKEKKKGPSLVYSATTRDHAIHPRNRRELASANAHGHSRYDACGDTFELALCLEGDIIAEAAYTAKACGPTIALGSLGTELLRGLTVDQARELNAFKLDELMGGLPPAKRHAYLLFLDSLHQALNSRPRPIN
jgi:NifU-like protein involved in Fe-S cluster formation